MTEQNKPATRPVGMPQRPSQQTQNRPMMPQSSQMQNRSGQPLSSPAQRQHPNMQPQGNMVRRPQNPQGRPQGGMIPPQRQGQMPQRPVSSQHAVPQRAVRPHQPGTQVQRSPIQPQRSMPGQSERIPTQPMQSQGTAEINTPSYQHSQMSDAQSFLSNSRNLAFILMGAVIFGILIGAMMFGGSSQPPPKGLQNVIRNQDIRQKLPLCGRVVKGQACVLYIMNATRYDQMAESFFDTALKLTEVPLRKISWANPKYGKQRIPPGALAEIFIPGVN